MPGWTVWLDRASLQPGVNDIPLLTWHLSLDGFQTLCGRPTRGMEAALTEWSDVLRPCEVCEALRSTAPD